MGTRKRRAERYRNGDCSLGWREGWAIADIKDEGTGQRQRIRLGRFKKNSQAARQALDQFAETRRAVAKHVQRYTVGQLWDRWLAEREKDGYRNDIYQAQWVSLKPAFGHRTPDLLETEDFRAYARARFEAGRSAWTVNTELVRLRACLKWASEQHLIDKRPKVWVPSPGKHRDRVLTFEEARRLVAAAAHGDPHVYVFVVVAFATGARHTAILDLAWSRVDFVEGTIEFDEDLPPDPMSKSWRKGRATVLMNRVVRAALEQAYAGRQTDFVVEHGGRRLKTMRNGFRAAVERAGIGKHVPHPTRPEETIFVTDVTPHTIRHTVVTWLDQASIEAKRAAQLVGHRDERTTKQVYTHASPEVLREAVAHLDSVFELHALPSFGPETPSEGRENDPNVQNLSRVAKSDEVKRSNEEAPDAA